MPTDLTPVAPVPHGTAAVVTGRGVEASRVVFAGVRRAELDQLGAVHSVESSWTGAIVSEPRNIH